MDRRQPPVISPFAKRIKLDAAARGEITPPHDRPENDELVTKQAEAEERWTKIEDALDPFYDEENRNVLITTPEQGRILLEHIASFINKEMYKIRCQFVKGYHLLQCMYVQVLGMEKVAPANSSSREFWDDLGQAILPWSRGYNHAFPWSDHEDDLSDESVKLASVSRFSSDGDQEVDFMELTRTVGHWQAGILKVGALANEHYRISKKFSQLTHYVLDSNKAYQEFDVSRCFFKPILIRVEECLMGERATYRGVVNKVDEFSRFIAASDKKQNNGVSREMEEFARGIWNAGFQNIKPSPTDVQKRVSVEQGEALRELANLSYTVRLHRVLEEAAASLANDADARVRSIREASKEEGQSSKWLPPRP